MSKLIPQCNECAVFMAQIHGEAFHKVVKELELCATCGEKQTNLRKVQLDEYEGYEGEEELT